MRRVVRPGLRRAAGEGIAVGGISGGPYLLAAAGLLDDRRFTIHWQHAPALIEAFPTLRPDQARFVIDRGRLTCGGGVAPLAVASPSRSGVACSRRSAAGAAPAPDHLR